MATARQSPSFQTEEGRAFYQERIGLAAGTVAALSGGFLIVSNLLSVSLVGRYRLRDVFSSPTNRWHALATLVSLAIAVRARRGGPLSIRTLSALDGVGTVTVMTAFAAMASRIPPTQHPQFLLLMIGMVVHMGRATVVPSTPRTTAIIGVVAAVPVLAVAYQVGIALGAAPELVGANLRVRFGVFAVLYCSLWCLMTVVTASLASRVIFGLRRQVREAMRLGQYTLEAKIGEGGMGTVYRARHAMLRRPTAIKLLPPERSNEQALARFEREVQLTSRLTHPNTVAVYDYGHTPDGVFYYAMEYLDGHDLQVLVDATGPLPAGRVVHVLVQVAGALAEAHSVGLVHRDIKPANVILCERGGVRDFAKVLDFGLVKEVASEGAVGATGAHVVLGTPLYASPEGIRGTDVDARSDLYSLGALGYFLLTGRPPFEGDSVLEVCSRHLHAVPMPPSERLGCPIPPDLEQLVLGCLAKEPSARPADAASLRAALEACDVARWTATDATRAWVSLGAKVRHHEGRVDPALAQTIQVAWDERGSAD